MRTAPVALAHLDDRDALAATAREVAALTHADPLAGESCVLWSEAIRVAIVEERIDVRAGLDLLPMDRRGLWVGWLDGAEPLTPNGFTVTALRAAAYAVEGARDLESGLQAAVRIGDDTDTVAAIAGGLLGARWGASAVPLEWRQAVHGWPGLDADGLMVLAEGLRATPRPQADRPTA